MTSSQRTAYDVAGHYDARYYGDLAERYRSRSRFARRRMRNVFSLLPPLEGLRLIDVGCGMGTFTIEAARRGADALGVDFAPAALAAARGVAAEEGLVADFMLADAAALPLDEASADVVLAADVTEHLDDDTLARVLSEAARVLRPGGCLVLYTPSPTHIFERLKASGVLKQDPSHIGVRPAVELAAAADRAGLRTERIAFQPSHLPVWSLLERLLGRWLPPLRRRVGLVARKTAP